MTETRAIHNPGSLVPVPITADALRYIRAALLVAAQVSLDESKHQVELADSAVAAGDKVIAAIQLRLSKVQTFQVDRYLGLVKEIDAAKDQTPAGAMAGLLPEGVAVIGRDLYQVAAAQIAAEKAGLSVPAGVDARMHRGVGDVAPGRPDSDEGPGRAGLHSGA